MASEGRFLTGSTMGHVVRMTMTSATGITFIFLVDAANLVWLSMLDEPVLLAAIGYAFAIQFFSVSSGVGMMIAATAVVSRSIGAGKAQTAREQVSASLLITMLFQTLVALLIIYFRYDLLAMVGAKGEAAQLAARYLAMTVPSLAIMAIALISMASLRAVGDGKRAMLVTLTSGSFSMVLDPVLIYWLELGLDGAAIVLIVSRIVMTAVSLFYMIRVHNMLGLLSVRSLKETWSPFMKVALPSLMTQLTAPFANYMLTGVMAGFGDAAVAVWAVINRLTVLAFGGVFALSGAIGGIFGQNFGAQQLDRLRTTYRDAILFCVIYVSVVWAILALAAGGIGQIFDLDQEAMLIFRAFTNVGAGAFLLIGMQYVSNAAFNTLGRPLLATILNWVRDGALVLPAALWLSGFYEATGVVYGQALAGVCAGIVAGLWGWRFVLHLSSQSTARA